MTAPEASLVVVCHCMSRELPRTLLSLSPAYQRNCPPGRVEIIVVDNGSPRPPRVDELAQSGLPLRLVACSRPAPSPVHAANEGIALARAALVGVWIDGARLASPGLLDACIRASRLHPRAVVATLNYQLGPQRQCISAERGYDQAAEDALLASVGWPAQADRLFSIATAEMRDPAGPMLESNALFMGAALWQELGGYDTAFDEPGGGVANPDVLLRACALPGAQLIRVLGEATFHQFHGGVSTSSTRAAMAVLQAGARAYRRLRGHDLRPVAQTGWLYDAHAGGLA